MWPGNTGHNLFYIMKLTKKHQKEIIQGVLPLLMPASELRGVTRLIYCIKGSKILCDETHPHAVAMKLKGGADKFDVNHEQRLKSIIKSASDKRAMINGLSIYLAKYGHKDADLKSIPYDDTVN